MAKMLAVLPLPGVVADPQNRADVVVMLLSGVGQILFCRLRADDLVIEVQDRVVKRAKDLGDDCDHVRSPLKVHAAQEVISTPGAQPQILTGDVADSRNRAAVLLVVKLEVRRLVDPQHLAIDVRLSISRVHVANHAPNGVACLLADSVVLLAVDLEEQDRVRLVLLGAVPQVPDPAPAVAARRVRCA